MAEEPLPGSGTVGYGDLFFLKSQKFSGQHVLQDTLANQLLAFPARQEVLWTEGTGRQDDHFLFSHLKRRPLPGPLTWLFFFSRTTVPSSISNSPWSFRHLTCGRVGEGEGRGHVTAFNHGGHHEEGAPLVSPGCRDSLVASCPA